MESNFTQNESDRSKMSQGPPGSLKNESGSSKMSQGVKKFDLRIEENSKNKLLGDSRIPHEMSLTLNAARTIQRVFRGSRSRSVLPRLRRFQAANLNAGLRLDTGELNTQGFWSTESLWPEGRPMCLRNVLFSDNTTERDNSDKDEINLTDYRGRQDKPLHKVLAMIESGIKGQMIYPHLVVKADMTKEKTDGIDSLFKEIVHTLKNGQKFYCNDYKSTRIDLQHLQSINSTWLKFRYFMGLGPPEPAPVPNLAAFTRGTLLRATMTPVPASPSGPLLVRQGSTRIAGGVSIRLTPPQPVDDLDERLQRLLNLR